MPHKNGKEKWMRTSFLVGNKPEKVDFDAGIIHGAAIVTEGPALGHGVFLDSEFVDTVVAHGNEAKSGMKVRFGHPSMSDNALGTYMGRAKNFRKDGQVARADIHLSDTSAVSPKGDLKTYALNLAGKEQDMFGMSIVFERGDHYQKNDKGEKFPLEYDNEKGEVIYPLGPEAPVFVECSQLLGADMVDEPAANPNGLFEATGIELPLYAAQISTFLDSHPEVFEFAKKNPEIVEKFMAHYEPKQTKKEPPMAEKKPVSEWAKAFGSAFAAENYDSMTFEDASKKFETEKSERLSKEQADRITALEAENTKIKADAEANAAKFAKEKDEADAKIAALSSGAPPVPFAEGKDTAKGKLPLSSLFSKKS